MQKKRLITFGLALGLGGCGGPSQQAKIATALETIMSDAVISFATHDTSSNSLNFSFNCGATAADGTFSYQVPSTASVLNDPTQLIQFIQSNQSGVTLQNVAFANCAIKACGDKIVLNGPAQLVLNVQPQALLQAGAQLSSIPANFQLTVTNLPVTGFVSGNFTFSYYIQANYTNSSLDSISLIDTPSPEPLSFNGVSFPAGNIHSMADGC